MVSLTGVSGAGAKASGGAAVVGDQLVLTGDRESPRGSLRGLTPLHLHLLGLLVEGATELPQIAAALGVDARTAVDLLRAALLVLRSGVP